MRVEQRRRCLSGVDKSRRLGVASVRSRASRFDVQGFLLFAPAMHHRPSKRPQAGYPSRLVAFAVTVSGQLRNAKRP